MFSLICARINCRVNNREAWWFETPSRPLWRHRNELPPCCRDSYLCVTWQKTLLAISAMSIYHRNELNRTLCNNKDAASMNSQVNLPKLPIDWSYNVRCNKQMCMHYDGVIMGTIASQIISLTVVYSSVYSDADQRKHQSSASLAFVWGIHRDRWIPRTKGQLRGKCFHLMTSSCGYYPTSNEASLFVDITRSILIVHLRNTIVYIIFKCYIAMPLDR